MRSIVSIFILSLLMTGNAANAGQEKNECAVIKQKIRHIQSKMRAGYNRAQGERMEAQLRKLRAQRAEKCR